MRRTATWLAACMAALLALVAMGCENDPDPVAVERVTLNTTALTLAPGDTKKLSATVLPENADDKTVTWQSSDTSIATVGNDGTVTTVNVGTTTITARAGGVAATCHIIVTPKPAIVESITLDQEVLPLTVGSTGYLGAMVVYQDIPDDTTMVAWHRWSSDTSVATVNDWGEVSAHAVGTATIYARAGDITAECAVTVNPVFVDIIKLSLTSISVTRGGTVRLTTEVYPKYADDKTMLWSSSDETVATVDSDGTVTTHKAGEVIITATARADGNGNAGRRGQQDGKLVVVRHIGRDGGR